MKFFPLLLKNRLYFLLQFQVRSKIEQKEQKVLIYSLSTVKIPHSYFPIIDF